MIFLHSSGCFFNAGKNKKSSIKGIDEDFCNRPRSNGFGFLKNSLPAADNGNIKKFTLLLRAAKINFLSHMKLVSYLNEGHDQLAFLVNGRVFDADYVYPEFPSSMSMFLNYWDDYFDNAVAVSNAIEEGRISMDKGKPVLEVELLSPIPFPASCRDAYAF